MIHLFDAAFTHTVDTHTHVTEAMKVSGKLGQHALVYIKADSSQSID